MVSNQCRTDSGVLKRHETTFKLFNIKKKHKKITQLIVHSDSQLKTVSTVIKLTPNVNFAKRCMYCTLALLKTAVGCPINMVVEYKDIKHNDKNSIDEYISYGVFCSLNCAKAFAIEKEHDQLFSQSCRYIEIIARKEQGDVVNIIPSPPKELLQMYGGYMSEEQYMSELGKIQYIPNGTTITHPLTLVYIRK